MCKYSVNVVKRGEIVVEADNEEQAAIMAQASQDKIKWDDDIICEVIYPIKIS